MQVSIATVTLSGMSPMTQSHQHNAPKREKESHEAYELRTWRNKLNTMQDENDQRAICIPYNAMHQCLVSAAKYSKRQIPEQGKSTWTAKFTSGIMLMDHLLLQLPVIPANGKMPTDPKKIIWGSINPDSVDFVEISAHVTGIRGSGKRVPRRFPVIPANWRSTFDVNILDSIITEDVFREMMIIGGMYVGVGQHRPENLGGNGRFSLEKLVWQDKREMVPFKPRLVA